MNFLNVLYGIFKDWHDRGHEKWKNEQDQKKLQELHAKATEIALKLPEELAMAFRNRNYLGMFSIRSSTDFYFKKYQILKNDRIGYLFTIVNDSACSLPVSDLKLITRQMNQDILKFKQDVYMQEGEEILAGFFPCLYQGACVARVANSPRSERELLLYII